VIYLLDTDVLNYVVKRREPALTNFEAALRRGDSFVLSHVVHFEITRYHKLREAAKLSRFYTDLVLDWPRVNLSAEDWDRAAELWAHRHRAGLPITDSDLLIAVSSLKASATLVTNNSRHFQGLGLSVESWTAEQSG
jgi:tRNA(fMet)-specific endonuclease VapC